MKSMKFFKKSTFYFVLMILLCMAVFLASCDQDSNEEPIATKASTKQETVSSSKDTLVTTAKTEELTTEPATTEPATTEPATTEPATTEPSTDEEPGDKASTSVGLSYQLNEDRASYVVKGLGTCQDKDINIPNTYNNYPVTGIDAYAFQNCNWITSIIIPSSVTSIGNSAFGGCKSLTSVSIPDSVTSLGDSAFQGCSSLKSIIVPNSVTSLGDSAFQACTNLTNIAISDNITSIGERAFFHCSNLTNLTIPNSVTSIGQFAFSACKRLESINLSNGVTSIGARAFNGCQMLTSISIPNSVTNIGEDAFSGCSALESITVSPENTTYHSAQNCLIETATKTLIAGCKNSIIPSDGSVTNIGIWAFYHCDSLVSITVPNGIIMIDYKAFQACASLTSITISDSVTSIGNYAFSQCSSLETVYYGGTTDDWKKISVGSDNDDLTSATLYYYSETQPTDTANQYWHYVDGVPTPW